MGGQIPLWVTIVLAVFAPIGTLGGALGGQWVAARATRTRDRDQAERGRAERWEERLLEALTSFVDLMDQWRALLCEASFLTAERHEVAAETFEAMNTLAVDAGRVLAKLRLIASTDLHVECLQLHEEYEKAESKIRHGDPVIQDSHIAENRFNVAFQFMVNQARKELGHEGPLIA